jgi:hypothetical protein
MEYVTATRYALKVCKTYWRKKGTPLEITLFPMIHIGEDGYYKRISDDLKKLDVLLHEGVSMGKSGEKKDMYKLGAVRIGLKTQGESIQIPEGLKTINIDMPSGQFREKSARLPIKQYLSLKFFHIIFWFMTIKYNLIEWKKEIIKFLGTEYGLEDEEPSDLDRLIEDERDMVIVSGLGKIIDGLENDSPSPVKIGIMFGAKHIRPIKLKLLEKGYRHKSDEWLTVIFCEPKYPQTPGA